MLDNNLVVLVEKNSGIRLEDGIDDLKMSHINVILEKLVMVQPESSFPLFYFLSFLLPNIPDSSFSLGGGKKA